MKLLNYRQFIQINESLHSEDEVTSSINNLENILAQINIETNIMYDAKNTKNSKNTIFLKVITTEQARPKVATFLTSELKNLNYETLEIPASEKHGIKFIDPQSKKIIYVLVKPDGKTTTVTDPNEAMVACLLAMGPNKIKINKNASKEELDDIIKQALTYKSSVINADPKVFNFFDGDYNSIAQAISAAAAIQKHIPLLPERVYLTGGSFPKDIEFLKINHLGMKDYNSSDLIIQYKDKYVGISLKKAYTPKALPTLLNKSIRGVLTDDKEINAKIDAATDNFFNSIVSKITGVKTKNQEWKAYISKLSTDEVNKEIKGSSSHFKEIFDIFVGLSEDTVYKLLSYIFKLDLKKMINKSFDFYLVTGIGNYTTTQGARIENGHITELNTIVSVIDELVKVNKLAIKPMEGKKQAFEEDATAAKLFFTITSGNTKLMNIEVRYKGSYTAQPQIFAFITYDFIQLLHR